MANIGLNAYKNMLDWSLKVSQPATPANIFIGLATGAPTTISFSEIAAGSNYSRASMAFAGAATPAGSASASNSTAVTFASSLLSSVVVSGMFISDSVSIAAGAMLWYGTISPVRTPLPGDALVLNAGALAITLS